MNCEPTNTAAFDALLDQLKCPVCKELMTEPFVTGCGHTFCHSCIMQTTSQRCPSCGTYMATDQVKPVFVLDKVLMAARRMAEARSSSGAQLATFLCDTPVIQTCEEVDTLINVLNQRRSELERNQITAQLQLLYLFLDFVRKSKEVELAEGTHQLNYIQQDLQTENENSIPGSAAALRISAPAVRSTAQRPEQTAGGAKVEQGSFVDLKRHQCISEHFGELQQQYLHMCSLDAQSNSINASGPQKGAVASQEPQDKQPAMMADYTTKSEQRLDQLDNMLRTVTQYTELKSLLEMLPARPGKRAVVTGLDFNSTAELLAAGGAGAHIQLHSYASVLAAGTKVHSAVAELPVSTRIASLAFSPINASQLLSCGDASGAIHLWDVTTNSVAPSAPSAGIAAQAPAPARAFAGHTGRVRSVSYSTQQPHMFASGSDDGTLRVWDVKSSSGAACSADLGSNVCGIAFNPWDENVLACGTAAHSVSVFDIRNCKAPISQVQGLEKTVAYVRFMSPSELAAASVNSTITLWHWENMERLQAFSGHVNVSNFAGMATSGDYIACGSETSQVHVYCKQLSKPILTRTLVPAQMPPSSSYFTLATVWKPHSTNLVVSLSTGSCHVLDMAFEGAS